MKESMKVRFARLPNGCNDHRWGQSAACGDVYSFDIAAGLLHRHWLTRSQARRQTEPPASAVRYSTQKSGRVHNRRIPHERWKQIIWHVGDRTTMIATIVDLHKLEQCHTGKLFWSLTIRWRTHSF